MFNVMSYAMNALAWFLFGCAFADIIRGAMNKSPEFVRLGVSEACVATVTLAALALLLVAK